MEQLTQLIEKLKPVELRLLRQLYQVKKNGEQNRKLELLNLIVGKKVTTDLEAAKKIYKKAPDSKFSHLKKRLRKDILAILLLPEASQQYRALNAQNYLACEKLITQGRILVHRQLLQQADKLLLKALQIAQDYEFPHLEIQARIHLRRNKTWLEGPPAFDKYNDGIAACFQLYQEIIKAEEYHSRFWHPYFLAENNETELIKNAQKYVQKLKELHEKSSSKVVAAYYYDATIAYYNQFIYQPTKAIPFIHQYIAIAQNGKKVDETALPKAYVQLLFAYIAIGNYQEAITLKETALQYSPPHTVNHYKMMIVYFHAHLYLAQYQEAAQCLATNFQNKMGKVVTPITVESHFYQAYLHFYQKQYPQAQEALLKCTEMTKNKADGAIAYKLLQIYIAFEQQEYYHLSFELENFRKLIEREKQGVARAKIIHKIAAALLRHNGDFQKIRETEQTALQKLTTAKGELVWDFSRYEVLRFEEWIAQK